MLCNVNFLTKLLLPLHQLGSMVFLKRNFETILVSIPANIYLFNVSNTNIRKRCEIRSKLTIKT